jgi:hypothetical protein
MASEKYIEQSTNLLKAIDIAIEVFKRTPPNGFNQQHVHVMVDSYKHFKKLIIEAEPKFQTLASLKYDIQNVFTFFQEASGETVNEFWKKIKEEGLPYERENRMEKLLKRGKIRNQIEYDYVIDTIVPFKQEGLINDTEFELLSKLIGEYEMKKR